MLSAQIPDSIKIGGFEYRVKQTDQLVIDDRRVNGAIRYEQLEIGLDKELPPPFMLKTLIHEILHALLNRLAIEFNDEESVERLSFALYDLLSDNLARFKPTDKNNQPLVL